MLINLLSADCMAYYLILSFRLSSVPLLIHFFHNYPYLFFSGIYWSKVCLWIIYLSSFWFSSTLKYQQCIRLVLDFMIYRDVCIYTQTFRCQLAITEICMMFQIQGQVLSYGIAGAIIFRLSVIFLGSATLQVKCHVYELFVYLVFHFMVLWLLTGFLSKILFGLYERGLKEWTYYWLQYFSSLHSRCPFLSKLIYSLMQYLFVLPVWILTSYL